MLLSHTTLSLRGPAWVGVLLFGSKRAFQKLACSSLLHQAGPSIPVRSFLHAHFFVFSILGRSFLTVFLGAAEIPGTVSTWSGSHTFGQPRFEFPNSDLSSVVCSVLGSFSSASGHVELLRRDHLLLVAASPCFGERIGGK